jgi:hypothetical protein
MSGQSLHTSIGCKDKTLAYQNSKPHNTRCPRTRAPEKKGEIFIKGQINNPNEKFFYLERYSRKEQFNSTNQSILSHPGLFPVIVC